jgi:hypothetical protein
MEVASAVADSGSTADSGAASDFTAAILTFMAGMDMAAVPITASTGAIEHTTCRTLNQIEGTSHGKV